MQANKKINYVVVLAIGAIVSLGLTACADIGGAGGVSSATPRRACVNMAHLNSQQMMSSDTLFVQDNQGNAALIKLGQPCKQMDELDPIRFQFSGTTDMCGPHDVEIWHAHSDGMSLRCSVQSVTHLTKEEAKTYSFHPRSL